MTNTGNTMAIPGIVPHAASTLNAWTTYINVATSQQKQPGKRL